jgi:hypothetical protein
VQRTPITLLIAALLLLSLAVPALAADEPALNLDLLPGVDLVTEEVEPGVYRVVNDGVRDLSERVHDVAVSADGEVWLELGTSKNWSVVRLGEPGASQTLGRKDPWRLKLTSDGVPVVVRAHGLSKGGFKMLDGEAWVKAELTVYDKCVLPVGSPGVVGADGGCWTEGDDEAVFVRIDADGTRTEVTHAELGLAPDQWVGPGVVAPDGTIWFPILHGEDHRFDGLAAYDGSTWSVIPFDGDDPVHEIYKVGVEADGVVWVTTPLANPLQYESHISSWDGVSWTSHRIEEAEKGAPLPIQVWPNGIIWFGPVATRWDGSTLSVVEPAVPSIMTPYGALVPLATAPDGMAWTVIEEQLYVITPEAVAAAE